MKFHISPYVVFGQKMDQRFKLEDPWKKNYLFLASNRFLALPEPGESFSFRKLSNQVFGFNCFITIYKGVEVSEGIKAETHSPLEMMVTFETDSDEHEFFVADFNGLVKYPE
jgi:hypothetical protein